MEKENIICQSYGLFIKAAISLCICLILCNRCFCQEKDTLRFTKPVPLKYPTTTTVVVLPSDTSYFRIIFMENNLKIKLRNEWKEVKDSSSLEHLIKLNNSYLQNKPVLLIGKSTTTYTHFVPILLLLVKYHLKWDIVSQD